MITQEQVNAYVAMGGNVCPVCGHWDVQANSAPETATGIAWQKCYCPKCEAEWADDYALVGVTLNDGDDEIVATPSPDWRAIAGKLAEALETASGQCAAKFDGTGSCANCLLSCNPLPALTAFRQAANPPAEADECPDCGETLFLHKSPDDAGGMWECGICGWEGAA